MKLSKIAAVVVVILGVSATGGSWYTGKQAEERYQEWIGKANQSLEKLGVYGVEAEIKEVEFKRHFFSSDISYSLEAKFNGESYDLKGEDKLYHGPIPLNRLTKGNLLPALGSIESKITLPENLKSLFHDKDLLGTAQNDISYAGDISGSLHIQPFKSERGVWDFSASEYHYELNKSGNGYFEGGADHYKVTDPEGNFVLLEKAEYSVKFGSDNQFANLTTGDFTMKAKKLVSNINEEEVLVITDLVSKGSSKVENGRYITKSDGGVAGFSMGGIDLGKGWADSVLDVDAAALNELMPLFSDPERFSEDLKSVELLQNLYKQAVKLHLTNFSLENEKGKNELSLVLNFDGMKSGNLDLMSMVKLFNQSSFKGKLDLVYLEALFLKFAEQEGLDKEQAVQRAKEALEEIKSSAVGSQLAQVDDKAITIDLGINNGKVVLNGREVSEGELQMALFVLMMGMGSLTQ